MKLPLRRSLAGYGSGDRNGDLAAGLTVGVMLIPQGMAYAMIAGLPPVYGLYAALVPPVVYALLGTSRQLAVGPVAMVSLLVATGVGPLAHGDPARYLALTLTVALLVGVLQIAMGVLRAGFLVNLLSHPVLAGFTSAAAIVIATSQLPSLLGLSIPRGKHPHQTILAAIEGFDQVHLLTVAIGAGAIAAALWLRRVLPRVPAPMLLVGVGTALSTGFGLHAHGVQIVGDIPSGFPVPTLPFGGLGEIAALLPMVLTIALVGFMESIAVAKVYASKNRYDISANQELLALGTANVIGAFFQSFPVMGGFGRTAVNAQSGARTQLAPLLSVAVIAVTLLWLTPLFYHLPKAVLAAIIVVAVAGLVDVKGARELWRVDRRDFALMLVTFAATIVFGIEIGILVGAALSVAVLLEQITRPHIAVLGRMPNTRLYRSVARNPEAVVEPGVEVLRMDASLFYGNAEGFRDAARSALERACAVTESPVLVLDTYPINRADSTGLHVLHDVVTEVADRGGVVLLAGAKGSLRDKLQAAGIVEPGGSVRLYDTTADATDAARALLRRPLEAADQEHVGTTSLAMTG